MRSNVKQMIQRRRFLSKCCSLFLPPGPSTQRHRILLQIDRKIQRTQALLRSLPFKQHQKLQFVKSESQIGSWNQNWGPRHPQDQRPLHQTQTMCVSLSCYLSFVTAKFAQKTTVPLRPRARSESPCRLQYFNKMTISPQTKQHIDLQEQKVNLHVSTIFVWSDSNINCILAPRCSVKSGSPWMHEWQRIRFLCSQPAEKAWGISERRGCHQTHSATTPRKTRTHHRFRKVSVCSMHDLNTYYKRLFHRLREQRTAANKLRRYYMDYHVQQRARMLKHRFEEDLIVQDLVDDCMRKYEEEIEWVFDWCFI